MPFLFLECRSAECSLVWGSVGSSHLVGECWGQVRFILPRPAFVHCACSRPLISYLSWKKKKISVPSFPSVMKMESCDT